MKSISLDHAQTPVTVFSKEEFGPLPVFESNQQALELGYVMYKDSSNRVLATGRFTPFKLFFNKSYSLLRRLF